MYQKRLILSFGTNSLTFDRSIIRGYFLFYFNILLLNPANLDDDEDNDQYGRIFDI